MNSLIQEADAWCDLGAADEARRVLYMCPHNEQKTAPFLTMEARIAVQRNDPESLRRAVSQLWDDHRADPLIRVFLAYVEAIIHDNDEPLLKAAKTSNAAYGYLTLFWCWKKDYPKAVDYFIETLRYDIDEAIKILDLWPEFRDFLNKK